MNQSVNAKYISTPIIKNEKVISKKYLYFFCCAGHESMGSKRCLLMYLSSNLFLSTIKWLRYEDNRPIIPKANESMSQPFSIKKVKGGI